MYRTPFPILCLALLMAILFACVGSRATDIQTPAASSPNPAYTNPAYGFSFDPPANWVIEEHSDHLIFRRASPSGDYFLFVGFMREGEEVPPFRTGMPSGDFVDGGSFRLFDQPLPRRLLVLQGKTKVVEYGANLAAGDLRLFIWLDAVNQDYLEIDIPSEIIAEADQIVASFSLRSK